VEHAAAEELWLDYAEGALAERDLQALRAHLEECDRCARHLERLVAAHRASGAAGRALREGGVLAPVPAAIEERVLSAARAASARAAPPRRPWLYPGIAALAVAASVLLVFRVEAPRRAEEAQLREALSLVAAPGEVRGPEDSLTAAAQDAQDRWRTGQLRLRSATASCPDGSVLAAGLVDAKGDPILVVIRRRQHTDVYAYREDGRAAGSARLVVGGRSQFLLPPRSRAEARAFLAAPGCGPESP